MFPNQHPFQFNPHFPTHNNFGPNGMLPQSNKPSWKEFQKILNINENLRSQNEKYRLEIERLQGAFGQWKNGQVSLPVHQNSFSSAVTQFNPEFNTPSSMLNNPMTTCSKNPNMFTSAVAQFNPEFTAPIFPNPAYHGSDLTFPSDQFNFPQSSQLFGGCRYCESESIFPKTIPPPARLRDLSFVPEPIRPSLIAHLDDPKSREVYQFLRDKNNYLFNEKIRVFPQEVSNVPYGGQLRNMMHSNLSYVDIRRIRVELKKLQEVQLAKKWISIVPQHERLERASRAKKRQAEFEEAMKMLLD